MYLYISQSIVLCVCYVPTAAALSGQQFLEFTASQLTYHGLCELGSVLRAGELAVFFRNNHFSTLYKRKVAHVTVT